jgi:stage II sporulation protein AA (anti-sigma F factor antagonist)
MKSSLTINIGELDVNKKYQIIQFNGDFDKVGYDEVHERLNDAVKSFSGDSLIFDLTNLKFINSEGIGYLMEVHAHLVKDNRKLLIVGPNDHVKDVFDTIGVSEVIPILGDLAVFLKA